MGILTIARWFAVERDLERLARWLPVIEGKSASLERLARSGAIDKGRGDVVDEHHLQLRHALAIHRRLQRLSALPGGARHLAVLRFTFLESGAEWRKRVDPRLDGGGLAEAVGRRFVDPKTAETWSKLAQRALRRALPRMHGQKLLDEATEAYVACVEAEHTDAPPASPRRAGGER